MKITKLLKTISCTAAVILIGTACSSIPVDDAFHVESPELVQQILDADFTKDTGLEIPPNKIILTSDFSEVFFMDDIMSTSLNEDGLVVARVSAGTRDDGFWKWSFCGIKPYELRYKFIWFDMSGKPVKMPEVRGRMLRSSLPGDLVRFSEVAPDETCKIFSFCIEAIDRETVAVGQSGEVAE